MIERGILLVVALVGAYQLWQAFNSGAATPDGRFSRIEQPQLYWSLLTLTAIVVGAFFYFAIVGIR
jgi:hypothetical protein